MADLLHTARFGLWVFTIAMSILAVILLSDVVYTHEPKRLFGAAIPCGLSCIGWWALGVVYRKI